MKKKGGWYGNRKGHRDAGRKSGFARFLKTQPTSMLRHNLKIGKMEYWKKEMIKKELKRR